MLDQRLKQRRKMTDNKKYLENLIARYSAIISDVNTFRDCALSPLPTCFWLNKFRRQEKFVESEFAHLAVDLKKLAWLKDAYECQSECKIGNTESYRLGLIHVQEAVAMLPVLALSPDQSHRVLDLCAAPGNKSLLCSQFMNNKGTIIANDFDHSRIKIMMRAAEKIGAVNISIVNYDAATLPNSFGHFDLVLADVPCSGDGTLRKNLSILQRCSEEYSNRLSTLQEKILLRAVKLCKASGKIVYATCSLAPEENEAVIDRVIRKYDGQLTINPLKDLKDFVFSEGIQTWKNQRFIDDIKHCRRVWPHQNNSGGFFFALLEKRGEISG